jgi:hypothetical protein
MNPLLEEMLLSETSRDLFYCNHWADDCFYMVLRPTLFQGSVIYGNFIMMIRGDMDTLHLTSNVVITNNGTYMKNICYEYSSSLSDDLTKNDFKKENYYESAMDVISCMFGKNIIVENTTVDNYLVGNSIWKELESVVEMYYMDASTSWGKFQFFAT